MFTLKWGGLFVILMSPNHFSIIETAECILV